MDAIRLVEAAQLKKDRQGFAPGDTVRVHVRVIEGEKERTQVFEGIVIRKRGEGAAERESFADGLLEPPQYTRPEEFRGVLVPGVLLSGDHARIARWRRSQALWLTWRSRPDLLAQAELTADDRKQLEAFERGERPE